MKLKRMFFVIILVFNVFNVLCYSQFSGGSGTIEDPWQISNVDELQLMKDHLNSNFILINDIDASATSNWNDGFGFIPIGTGWYIDPTLNFQGSLNGNNYSISNLYIEDTNSKYLGLFGSLGSDAVVESTNIIDSYIEGNNFVGGLVGMNRGTINNCSFTGEVYGVWDTGGLVGQNYYGSISNSFSSGIVTGHINIGGIVGKIIGGKIDSSYFTGNVDGGCPIGGIIGSISKGIISNSFYNVDSVQINEMNYLSIGGIYNNQYLDWFNNGLNLNIENYSNTLIPNGDYYEISSIEGLRDLLGFSGVEEYKFILKNPIDLSSVSNLYIPYLASEFDGDDHIISNLNIDIVDGSNLGMFGYLSNSGTIKNCVINDLNITGKSTIGGLVAINDGTIENSNIQGNINGVSTIGGLVGSNEGSIRNSSADVVISGIFELGGLIGGNDYIGIINNSFASGSVYGDYWLVGGFAGYNYGTISFSYSACDATGRSLVGGFVGVNEMGNITDSYSRGNISRIASSTSTDIGGFAGSNNRARIINCYSTGNVQYEDSEDPTNKGFCGYVEKDVDHYEMSGNYWDVETSLQDSTAGEAVGRSTSEMIYPYGGSTYVDWDFSTIWRDDITNQNDGYPTFMWYSGIENDENTNIAKGFELFQNYPNPFNNQTIIKYILNEVGNVELTIFNSNGQFIQRVVNEKMGIGKHSVLFEADKLSAGVYYYKLCIDGIKQDVKKMLYLR